MTESDAAREYLDSLRNYFEGLGHSGLPTPLEALDFPKPPTMEVALEVGAAASRAMAMLLDYRRFGHATAEPSNESRLEVAAMLDHVAREE